MLARTESAVLSWLRQTRGAARRLLAPRCVICGVQRGDPACGGCVDDFLAPTARCAVCAIRLPGAASEGVCGPCLRRPPAFDASWALADYAPPLDGMVLALKFGHRLDVAHALGRLLAAHLPPTPADRPLLMPVPLAFERQAERGFNQALEMGRTLAAARQIAWLPHGLLRVKHNAPQEALSLQARRRNVRGAFAVQAPVAGRHVLVLDDVMTSGSTLEEVARVLKAAAARRVTNLVVARTP